MQYAKDDPRSNQYVQYYFPAHENQDAYPHIAIVDPRTGEQVKVWSGSSAPKAADFLMQLHEFLDRYSLKASAKNPVAKRKPEVKKATQVNEMTEDQMLEMALQNSLAGQIPSQEPDPDELTRSIVFEGDRKEKEPSENADMIEADSVHANGLANPSSLFTSISSIPHTEPPSDASSTRIQFRHPNGRIVRRFLLVDPVTRIYEWLKASPIEGKNGIAFELVFMQKNLISFLDDTIEQAGLKNGTVMVEFVEA